MTGERRKAAIAAYKERNTVAGIYAVRCSATGQQWVGRAPDLDTVQNRLWFTLRQGNNPHRSLQMAWCEHGDECFVFERLERLEEEPAPYLRDAALKERLAYWRNELNATAI